MISSECLFISGAANTVANSAKWFTYYSTKKTEYIAYSCHNLILITNMNNHKVICSLKGHLKRITCLNVITSHNYVEIISASDDACVYIWRNESSNMSVNEWKRFDYIPKMNSSINALSCQLYSFGSLLTMSDTTGLIRTYFRASSSDANSSPTSYTLIDELKLPPSQMACSLHIASTDTNTQEGQNYDQSTKQQHEIPIFLFIGSVDSKLYIRMTTLLSLLSHHTNISHNSELPSVPKPENSVLTGIFRPCGALFGHEEWVTTLDTINITTHNTTHTNTSSNNNTNSNRNDTYTIMLASGSKDTKIRLWRINIHTTYTTPTTTTPTTNIATHTSSIEQEEEAPVSPSPALLSMPEITAADTTTDDINNSDDEDEEEDNNIDTTTNMNKTAYTTDGGDDDSNNKNEARLYYKYITYTSPPTTTTPTTTPHPTLDTTTSINTAPTHSVMAMTGIAVFLEALLFGHEDWVSCVQFMPVLPLLQPSLPPTSTTPMATTTTTTTTDTDPTTVESKLNTTTQPSTPLPLLTQSSTQTIDDIINSLQLFSTSMDRNMCIWTTDTVSGIWSPRVRIGDLGGQLGGSVGGNLLGFVGGHVCSHGKSVLGIGYGGSLHLWSASQSNVGSGSSGGTGGGVGEVRWRPEPFISGHFDSVTDLKWGASGGYIVTVSSDQTSRIFAPIPISTATASTADAPDVSYITSSSTHAAAAIVNNRGGDAGGVVWREISRPQVHGYNLNYLVLRSPPLSTATTTATTASTNDSTTTSGPATNTNTTAPTESKSSATVYRYQGLPQSLITASDEKVIRMFTPPESVKLGVKRLCNIDSEGLVTR